MVLEVGTYLSLFTHQLENKSQLLLKWLWETQPNVTSKPHSWVTPSPQVWVSRTWDLLLTNRVWQRWWAITPVIILQHIYKTPSYQTGGTKCPTGLQESSCGLNCLWRGPHRRELEVASVDWKPQSYDHKDLNSSNNRTRLEEDTEFQKGMQPSQCLDCSLLTRPQ